MNANSIAIASPRNLGLPNGIAKAPKAAISTRITRIGLLIISSNNLWL
jgi:hypothetical protein